MTHPILEFDPSPEAFIEPSKIIQARDLPEHCVICFFREVIDKVISEYTREAGVRNLEREIGGIVPYPPGIPVLVPGQLITPKVAEFRANLLRSHKRTELHGIVHEGYQPCVRVLRPAQERGLRRIG